MKNQTYNIAVYEYTGFFALYLKNRTAICLERGCFGLEKENVRVNQDGTLALTPHPAVFGDKGKHPYITTDFSESQVEMITRRCQV